MDEKTREAELQAAYEWGQKIGGTAAEVTINATLLGLMFRAARRGDTASTVAWATVYVTGRSNRSRRNRRQVGEVVLGAVRHVGRPS